MHPRSVRAKAVQKVHIDASRWRGMTHDLARACELSSASKAAARSTLNPDTDPARLRPTACTSLSWHPVPQQHQKCAQRQGPVGKTIRRARHQPFPLARPAIEARCSGESGPSRAAHVQPVDTHDTRDTRVTAASQTVADSLWGGSRPISMVHESILNVLRRGAR